MTTERETVNEEINAELPRPSDAELAAAINSALDEIARLKELNGRITAFNFDLQLRLDCMVRIANQVEGHATGELLSIIDGVSDTGTHADRSMSILATMRRIVALARQIAYDVNRVKQAARGDNTKEHQDYDDIPF